MPYGDVPPIRVYFLAFESETGCLFSSLTQKQGAKFVRSLRARVPIHSTVWHLPVALTYLSFVQEINPSFDVLNIFRDGPLLFIGGGGGYLFRKKNCSQAVVGSKKLSASRL